MDSKVLFFLGHNVTDTQCGQFENSSTIQILREINLGQLEASNTGILTILAAQNFEFCCIFDIFKC